MPFASLFRRWFSRPVEPVRKRTLLRRPKLERLEDRTTPATLVYSNDFEEPSKK